MKYEIYINISFLQIEIILRKKKKKKHSWAIVSTIDEYF